MKLTARPTLGELARLFLTLGFVGFGGPAAHIAMMREQVVRRRGWVDDDDFGAMIGAVNLIPGPNSTELAMHIGQRRAGWKGLIVAGCGFILPAVLIVSIIAVGYDRWLSVDTLTRLRYGVMPVVVAIVVHAVAGLSGSLLSSWPSRLVGVGAFAAYLAGVSELVILAAAAVLLGVRWRVVAHAAALPFALAPVAGDVAARSPLRIFAVFAEVGAVLFGSGYVLLAFLQSRLVDDLGWLTVDQVVDASAVGQVTPGPVFTTATFIGWQLSGWQGAVAATVGIFGPSFLFVAALGRLIPWIRARSWATRALHGVTVASLGLMGGVAVLIADTALIDPTTVAVGASALVVLSCWRLNSVWLIAVGVIVGLVFGPVATG